MTLKKIGQFIPVISGGGRYKIPEAEGFYQMSGVQFKVINLLWITPTDNFDVQDTIEKAVKEIVEGLEYQGEPLLESVIIGDSKPKGLSTALIECQEPNKDFVSNNQGRSIRSTATGSVTFVFKEDLSDARMRRKKAPAFFIDYILKTDPYLRADI